MDDWSFNYPEQQTLTIFFMDETVMPIPEVEHFTLEYNVIKVVTKKGLLFVPYDNVRVMQVTE